MVVVERLFWKACGWWVASVHFLLLCIPNGH